MIRTTLPRRQAIFLTVASIAFFLIGCDENGDDGKPTPIFLDEYSLYILDAATFVKVGPEFESQKNFLDIKSGEVQISFGKLPGAYLGSASIENQLTQFSRDTNENPQWLLGCHRWLLDVRETTIGDQWYYTNTLLVRRDPSLTKYMNQVQLAVHEKEFSLFPDDEDRILRMYYGIHDDDIYVFTISGSPEEFVAKEAELERVMASIRYTAADAMAAEGTVK